MPGKEEYTSEEVSAHCTADDLWVVHEGKVYDVTEFSNSHPGGPDLLLINGGKDISKEMDDEVVHEHSNFAYEMMEEYKIGQLDAKSAAGTTLGRRKSTSLDDPDPNFLDVTKPLWPQMWNATYTKEYYLRQVHVARHIKDGSAAPIFGNFLEPLTKTKWYVIPMIWGPVITYMFYCCLSEWSTQAFAVFFTAGLFLWTFLEYLFHCYLFHMEDALPDHPIALAIHFLAHGIHHFLPMDHDRLVMPPTLFAILASPVVYFFNCIFPWSVVGGIGGGAIFAYVCYDLGHYYSHHGIPISAYLKEMKTYHLNHHYKNYNEGFGVTTKFWDKVFKTELKTGAKAKKHD